MMILSLIKKVSPTVIGVVGVVGVVGFLLWRNDTLSEQRDNAVEELASLQLQYDSAVNRYEKMIEEMVNVAEENARRQASSNDIREEIDNASPDEDGAVAPILRNTIERLRQR